MLVDLSEQEAGVARNMKQELIANLTGMPDEQLLSLKKELEQAMIKNWDAKLRSRSFLKYILIRARNMIPFRQEIKRVLVQMMPSATAKWKG